MKRVLAIVLAAGVTAMTMVGCGSSNSGNSASSDATSVATGSSQEKASSVKEAPNAVHLTLAHADAPDGSANGEATKAFKQLVEEKSNGSIIIDIYPSAQLGSVSEAIASCQGGTVDFTPVSTSFLSNFCPEVGVFDLPFLFDDYDHVWEAMDGKLADTLNTELEKNNLIPLIWTGFGFRNVTSSKNHMLNTVDDFKGFRIRIQPSDIQKEIFSALGADPAPIDWGELYTALQQGTVDGEENPYIQIYSSNIYEVNNVIYKTEHEFAAACFLMSSSTKAKLTDDQYQILMECVDEYKPEWRNLVEKMNDESLQALKDKGCTFVDTLDKDAMREKTESVYDNHSEYADMVSYIRGLRQ